MERREFGSTGWTVSLLSLGTVELGIDQYGLYEPGEAGRPAREQAIELLLHAFSRGIDLLDTAPGYGESEEILGEALRRWDGTIRVATKVDAKAPSEGNLPKRVEESLARSAERLGKSRLDLLQIHNATADDLIDGPLIEALVEARARGLVEHLGASVYGPTDALVALRHDELEVVQVAFNLLDQRAAQEVFLEADGQGQQTRKKALLIRSALLKGVLTNRRRQLPEHLTELNRAADRAERWASKSKDDLTTGALRFCLSQREIGSVLIGVRSIEELETALRAAEAPPLPRHRLSDAGPLALEDEDLIDPRFWNIP